MISATKNCINLSNVHQSDIVIDHRGDSHFLKNSLTLLIIMIILMKHITLMLCLMSLLAFIVLHGVCTAVYDMR